jgi:PAS domain S-box-containing protein
MKDKSLRVLIVEDSEDDVLLAMRALKKGGHNPFYERVETAAAMKQALQEKQWDIILCDYKMPKFDAPSAIAVLKEANIDVPIIIVSGTIGEEMAVECMRLGAQDYFMKNKLSRLCPAIARHLEDAKVRIKQKQAESQREAALEALKKSEALYRLLADNISEHVWIMDLNLNLTYISPSVEKLYGYAIDEVKKLKMKKLFTAESYQKVVETYSKELSLALVNPPPLPGTRRVMELEAYHKDGHQLWIENRLSFIRDENGKPIALMGETRDITERKLTQELLKKSEEQYRLLADHMKDQVWLMDLNMNITYVSPSIERLMGYSSDEMKKLPWDKLLTPESFKKAIEFISIRMPKAIKASSKDLIFRTLELEFTLKGGQKIWGECSFSFIRDDQGKAVSILGESRNITERKLAEEKLHQSEEKYRTILEDIQEGYFEVDLNGNFIFFNDTLCRVSGYSREELMGMNNRQYTEKDELKRIYEAYNKIYITGEPNKELVWRITRKDGAKRYIEGYISLLKDSSGKPTGFRGIAHDITERKEIEEKLQEEEQRFRTLSEQSSDIIIMINREGIITYENPAVYILGINPEERIGASVFERVHPDDLTVITDLFHLLFSDPNALVQKADVRLRHEDGSWRTFEAMGSNLVRDNVTEAAIVNLRDITERKHSEEKLQQTLDSLKRAVGTTIQVLVSVLESRDPYTAGHQSRSSDLACAIANEMGLDQDKIEGIRMAGTIHDIGKLAVPTEILTKPTKLTNLEFSLIKEHSQGGYEMLKDVESPWQLAKIVQQHHERMNGSGYPKNLKGDEILLESRILAVADVVEAMASHRPYRASLGIEAALAEIETNKGILYDKAVADACLRLFREKGYHLT